MTTVENIVKFHQGNMEAVVRSSQIWAAGWQNLSKHVATEAQHSMQETVSTFRAMTGVKSLKEALELQSSFARTAMEKAMRQSTRLTETGLELAGQATAPLAARARAAVEVMTARA